MRIAVPVRDGVLSAHFGHSPEVTLLDVDRASRRILSEQTLPLPPHSPGSIPRFIIQHQPDLVLACGVGERAVVMLADAGIRVIDGSPITSARQLVEDWLHDRLTVGPNGCEHTGHACDHDHEHEHGHDHEHRHDHRH